MSTEHNFTAGIDLGDRYSHLRGSGIEGRGKGAGKLSPLRLFPATARWGMAAAIGGRPNFKWQRRPGRIPSSTEPPSTGSSRVRTETKRKGFWLIELPLCKATTLALDRMCLLIEHL